MSKLPASEEAKQIVGEMIDNLRTNVAADEARRAEGGIGSEPKETWTCNCRTGCNCIVSKVPHCHYCKKGMETK